MANKRMFTMKIVDSDAFLEMPPSAQCLYFHLNMRADDDGFLNNAKKIMRIVRASEDDLKILIGKNFVIPFENGVIVIKHWRMHNVLTRNRYHETQYKEEKSMLKLKDNGAYSLSEGKPIDDSRTIEQSERQMTLFEGERAVEPEEKYGAAIKRIIWHMNEKCNTRFSAKSKDTAKHINARFDEGYTEEDFYHVIDVKSAEWMGTEMEKYLRPETLFCRKFQNYINQYEREKRNSAKANDVMERFKNVPQKYFFEMRSAGIIAEDGGLDLGEATEEQIKILKNSGAL